jgi:hypothetical protein
MALELQFEIGLQRLSAVLAEERYDGVESEQRVGGERGFHGVALAVARRRADDQVVRGCVALVDDAVPEPGRVDQHVAGHQLSRLNKIVFRINLI